MKCPKYLRAAPWISAFNLCCSHSVSLRVSPEGARFDTQCIPSHTTSNWETRAVAVASEEEEAREGQRLPIPVILAQQWTVLFPGVSVAVTVCLQGFTPRIGGGLGKAIPFTENWQMQFLCYLQWTRDSG